MLASNSQNPEITLRYKNSKRANIVVSKIVAKKAVDRNRIKRIIREAKREIGPAAESYTVIVRKNIKDFKTGQVTKILENLINKWQKTQSN